MVFLWFSYGFPMVFLWFEMILLGICVPVVAVKFLEDAIDLTEISEDRTNKMRSLRWNLMISGDKDSPNRYIIYIYLYIYIHSIVIRISSKHPQSLNSHGVSPQTVSPRVPVDRSQPTSAGWDLRPSRRSKIFGGRHRPHRDFRGPDQQDAIAPMKSDDQWW